MPIYILLLTLTPEGREKMLDDPETLLRAEDDTNIPGIQRMGLYGVLGAYDFVSIIEASDNEAVARFSIELGVRAGVQVHSLPAIPISRLEGREPHRVPDFETSAALPLGGEPTRSGPRDESN